MALEDEVEPALARDRRDHAERQAFGLEHRSLLDVDLEVGLGGGRIQRRPGLLADRAAQRHAAGVAQVQLVRRELADERAAAEVDALEAQPVLVGEGHDLQRRLGQRLRDRQAHQDAEHAVVAAGVGDGVQV
jgi:hypothetical protein